jgi:Flp pilus assembly protein protease CpaA
VITYVVLLFTLFSFLLASLEDIKKKEIYDYINFFYAISILTIAIFHSFYLGSFDPIKYSGFGMLLAFLVGGILYLIGMWGGGDAKFLIGFGASIPYLKTFSESLVPSNLLPFLLDKVSSVMVFITDITAIYILLINSVVLLCLFIFMTKKREKQILFNALTLFLVLILLSLGLFIDVDPFILFLWGFLAFTITFFSDDYLFDSLYLRVKKKVSFLEEGDVLDTDFKTKELYYSQETFMDGIPREILPEIKKNSKKLVVIRKMFPLGMLMLLNFILFGIKILSIDIENLEIMAFLLKFLLASFLVGGVLIMFMILFYVFKNFESVSNSFSKIEKSCLKILLVLIVVFIFINKMVVLLLSIGLIYYFFRVSKLFENTMFVLKKPLSSLVPGDWIVQDIKVKGKEYFLVEDFKLGVEEDQLNKIKELAKKHPSLNNLLVKDGIAFLPPLFIGFLLIILI